MVSRPTPHAPERAVDRLLTRNDRTETASPLRSTSVTNGRTRFFGEESLIVIGSQLVSGFLRVTGRLIIDGLGILTVQNLIELFGSMKVKGGGSIDLDGGKIQTGAIRIENGKIYVGDSIVIDSETNTIRVGEDIVIDGATGVIRIGEMILDPSENGGMIKFPGGGEVYASEGTLSLYSSTTGAYITLDGDAAEVHGPGINWIRIDADGIQFVGVPTISETESGGHKPGGAYLTTQGRLRRVIADPA